MAPQAAVQFTGMLAVRICVLPCARRGVAGDIPMGETTVTGALAAPLPSLAVAVTLQVVLGYRGAVKTPAAEMEPQVVVHLEGTDAVNCCVAPSCTVADAGVTVAA